jgi:hypothetical protein
MFSSGGLGGAGLVSFLPKISQPIENVVYKQKQITLDGYKFKNCAFIGCQLFTDVGNFVLEECFLNPQTVFFFKEDALRVVKLASLLDFAQSPGLQPVWHPDGSITIE